MRMNTAKRVNFMEHAVLRTIDTGRVIMRLISLRIGPPANRTLFIEKPAKLSFEIKIANVYVIYSFMLTIVTTCLGYIIKLEFKFIRDQLCFVINILFISFIDRSGSIRRLYFYYYFLII